jgi:hypothetical protein
MLTYLVAQLALALYNIGNACFDSRRIMLGKRIYHGLNLVAYAVWVGLLCWLCQWNAVAIVLFCISSFCNRQISFDIPLNLMRDLPWDYVSKYPKSITDKLEITVFGYNGKAQVACYTLVWLVIGNIIINYLHNL